MKTLSLLALTALTITSTNALACKMTAMGHSATLIKAVTDYVVKTTFDNGTSTSRSLEAVYMDNMGVIAEVIDVQGTCTATKYTVDIDASCTPTVKASADVVKCSED